MEPSSAQALAQDFHRRFGLMLREHPQLPGPQEVSLRLRLLVEELLELVCAMHGQTVPDGGAERLMAAFAAELARGEDTGEPSLAEVARETGDLLMVVYGTACHYGFDADAALTAVYESNLSKLGEDGQPLRRADGKILKGPGFEPPDMRPVVGAG